MFQTLTCVMASMQCKVHVDVSICLDKACIAVKAIKKESYKL